MLDAHSVKARKGKRGRQGGYQKTVEKAKKKRDRMRQRKGEREFYLCAVEGGVAWPCLVWRSLMQPILISITPTSCAYDTLDSSRPPKSTTASRLTHTHSSIHVYLPLFSFCEAFSLCDPPRLCPTVPRLHLSHSVPHPVSVSRSLCPALPPFAHSF